jgi:CHAT domain-containing protein
MSPVKILLVENDPTWQDAIESILVPPDFQLEIAHTYRESVVKIQSLYDLVITNLCLIGDSDYLGEELLSKLDQSHIPCIVLTGSATSMTGLLERHNVDEIFIKGRRKKFNEGKFLASIYKIVDKSISASQALPEEYVDFDLHIDNHNNIHARSEQGERQSNISLTLPNCIIEGLEQINKGQTDENFLRQFGKCLYDLIFPAPIHTHFNQTEAVAHRNRQKVRIRLMIQPDTLSQIPWEFIYREEGGYFLAVNPDTVLSRYLNLPLPQSHVGRQGASLNMLLIIADPKDQVRLNPDMWEDLVRRAIAPIEQKITIQVVKDATRKNITSALLQQKPDIVQFVGHGIYQNGKGHLALVDGDGETWLIDDSRFANLFLGADDRLRLVCLATCESAKSDSLQGFLGIAPQLVQRGIPAVVAMQYSVRIKTAKTFFEEFYDAIAVHKPVDWAVQWARNQISLEYGLDNREFATPVLYVRAEDGNIF